MKFHIKNWKNNFEKLISCLFDEVHCSPIFFNDPSGIHLSGSNFLLHQKCPKKPQSVLSLASRGWNSLPGACSDLDLEEEGKDYNTSVECHTYTHRVKCHSQKISVNKLLCFTGWLVG